MAPKSDPEYSKMLDTPAPPADGLQKNAIESLQKQIDFHVGEVNRLRYAQNTHVPIFRLPFELLAEAFLCLVESGLRDDGTRFATGTFSFLRVCRRWNEVALGLPQLWGWWVVSAVKVWPLFNSRSKGAPIFLTWRSRLHDPARSALMDPAIPRRICELDLTGSSRQMEDLFCAFDSSPPSNARSIRLRVLSLGDPEPQERLSRFLSTSFPKLSQLVLGNLPPKSFPILTTSSLTSLKIFIPYGKSYYTSVQFSRILQQHPNLRELELVFNAIPLPGPTGTSPVSFTLPQLTSLGLYGMDVAVVGFLDFIGMSSPLHDVVLRFSRPPFFAPPDLVDTVKRVLAAYYECPGLNHPRKVNHLSISHNSDKHRITFNTRSHLAAPASLRSNLKLQLNGISAPVAAMKKAFPLFPLNDVRGLALEGSVFYEDECRWMFGEIENLSYLRLDDLDLWSALNGLTSGDRDGPRQQTFPKLGSLTLSHLEILFDCERRLLDFLKERRRLHGGLKKLVLRSCLVQNVELRLTLEKMVPEVGWENVELASLDYSGPDDDSHEEHDDGSDDDQLESYYESTFR